MSSPDPEAPSDAPEADDPSPQTPNDSIRKALKGYRIFAWATGVWLIALCTEMVLKYIVKVEWPLLWLVAPIHGWIYFIYLLFTANLATKVRWPIGKTIGVLLAGTIPLLGIIVEHFQTKQIKAAFNL